MVKLRKLAMVLWYALKARPKYVIYSGIHVPVKLRWIVKVIFFEMLRQLKEWLDSE